MRSSERRYLQGGGTLHLGREELFSLGDRTTWGRDTHGKPVGFFIVAVGDSLNRGRFFCINSLTLNRPTAQENLIIQLERDIELVNYRENK